MSEEAVKQAITNVARFGESVSESLAGFGGYLRCRTCGYSRDLGDPGRRVMGQGWPKCCGYTMEWITQRQIDSGERPARGEAE